MQDKAYIQKLEETILWLLSAGDDLVPAAETCGHDDCIEAWEAESASAKKLIHYDKRLGEFEEKAKQAQVAAHTKREKQFFDKQKKENAKHAAEDDALLRELGYR